MVVVAATHKSGLSVSRTLPASRVTLVANPDTTESQREEANGKPLANADDRPRADIESEILVTARCFADGQPAISTKVCLLHNSANSQLRGRYLKGLPDDALPRNERHRRRVDGADDQANCAARLAAHGRIHRQSRKNLIKFLSRDGFLTRDWTVH
jgi:hypothetical protein